MRQQVLVRLVIVLVATSVPDALRAQQDNRDQLVVGVAPFLTRERTWNFANNIAANLGVERDLGPVGLRLQATIKRGGLGKAPDLSLDREDPRARNGVSFATLMVIRTPYRLYATLGPEWFGVAWQNALDQMRRGTFVGSGGIGIRLGPAWSVESRYGHFANQLGATHGHLELGVMRYLER